MRRLAPALLCVLGATACPGKSQQTPIEEPTPVQPAPPDGKPVEPAQPPLSESARFTQWCHAGLAEARAKLDAVKAPVKGDRTNANTLEPFNDAFILIDNVDSLANLYPEVHPDESMRTAAEECQRDTAKFKTEIRLDRDLFEAMRAVQTAGLDPAAARFQEKTVLDFKRGGVDKDDATRARLRELSDRATELGQAFDRNIREDVRTVEFDPKEVVGLPQDWLDAHKPNEAGKIAVTTDYPDWLPFRMYARDAAARMKLYVAFMNRGWPVNDQVLRDLLTVRQEQAKLLGYADFADYQLQDRMMGTGAKARTFIDRVAKVADKRAKRDYQALLKRMKRDVPSAKAVTGADAAFYEDLIKREQFKVDSQEVREYFSFPAVRDGLLTVTGALFGVRYEEAPTAPRWHPDVAVYDVYLTAGGEKLGRIYLDLHPRENKFKHAAQTTLVSGIAGRQLPEGVLMMNLPTGLMQHDDVVTTFHEFGHLMHHILAGRQKWVRFSGVATEWDFVEAPSQMLEEWAWDTKVLQQFAKKGGTDPIPDELVKRMRAADEFGQGYLARAQMFYASLSLRIHQDQDPTKLDLTKVVQEEQKRYSSLPYVPETHMHANFGHLNGYGAGYYTYMWSLVIAKDMFSEFKKKGLMDPTTANRYRDMVLAPGGSLDAAELVRNFLGRDFNFDAFQQWLEGA